MASQHNENLLMPCAAAAMKLTDCTELLFVLFRSFDMCQCIRMKGRFYLTGVNHFKAHCTQFEDSSGAEARTMKNVAVVTNLRIYHWTIKQSCSAGNGTHWTHVPWCVQSHVKTQLTFWQHPPFCFHLPFSAPVPAYPVCGLCCDLALYLRGSDYHIHIHFIQRCSFFVCVCVCGERANAGTRTHRQGQIWKCSLVKWEVSLWCGGHMAHRHVFGMTFPLFMSGTALPLVWVGSVPAANLIIHSASTYPSSLIVHRGDSWHSAVYKRPLKNMQGLRTRLH